MKITKRQLKRIIKEEKAKLLPDRPEGALTAGDLISALSSLPSDATIWVARGDEYRAIAAKGDVEVDLDSDGEVLDEDSGDFITVGPHMLINTWD